MDDEALFRELVGAFCAPLIIVRQFPNSISRLRECVGTSGLQILKNAVDGNVKASAFTFADYDRITSLLNHDLEYNLLDSLNHNDKLVSESIDYELGHYCVDYSKWFRDWCITLALGLRVKRHKRYKIPIERNGVFIFIHQKDDLGLLKKAIEEWADFKLSIVYLSEEYPEEFTTLMTQNTVQYCIINTREDIVNSPQLLELLEQYIDSCYERLEWSVELLQSSVKSVKLTSKMLASSEAEKYLGNVSLLMCEELGLGKDGIIYSVIKSNLDHEIVALSELLYGFYFYKYGMEKLSEYNQVLNQGDEADRSTGYSVIAHFDKAIAHFNRHNCLYESFFVSILSLLVGEAEELNKLLAKNSVLELSSRSDYARSALCLELSSIRCTKIKRKNFQLVMAGHLFNQACFENLSKRCYLACIDEYEGWDVSKQHLYGLLGNFDARFIVNSLNIIANAYENRYSNQYSCDYGPVGQSSQQIDLSLTQSAHLVKLDYYQNQPLEQESVGGDSKSDKSQEVLEQRSESSESDSDGGNGVVSSDKEIYYLKKLIKLRSYKNDTKNQLSTPISGSFQNYPTIYYVHHYLPAIEGLTPFLVRVPIIYQRKNGIIGTNIKISTCYVDDLYEKLLENSFKDDTWQKCIRFYNIRDHVKKDFFSANNKDCGANYMTNTNLNLSLQLLNPLNLPLELSSFKILLESMNSNGDVNDDESVTIVNKDVVDTNSKSVNTSTLIKFNDSRTLESGGSMTPHTRASVEEKAEDADEKYKWVDCEILSQDKNEGFHMEPFEKKNLVLTFRTSEVGSFKIKGVSWKLFNCVYFWSPVYTVGKKLKNYESCKSLTLDEFIAQRAVERTLYFNVYENRPTLKYSFSKISDLSRLKNSVFFSKKDLEYVNCDNQLMFYTEKYAKITSELALADDRVEGENRLENEKKVNDNLENENLRLFEYFNGESGLIEISLQNLKDNPIDSILLRFKVLGVFRIVPYPVSYKVNSVGCGESVPVSRNANVKLNSKCCDHAELKPGAIEFTWNVINFPNVKVKEDNLTEKMYEVYLKFKHDEVTLHRHSLSIYLFAEPVKFLDGIALVDGSISLVPRSGLDLQLPFKLFLKVKTGPEFSGHFDYKDSVKIQVNNKSGEHIAGLDFSVNGKPVRSTNEPSVHSNCLLESEETPNSIAEGCEAQKTDFANVNGCELVDIPPRSSMSFVVPIENAVQILVDKHNKSSEKMNFTVFWCTSRRFGVYTGNVGHSRYRLCLSLSSSHRELRFTAEPVAVTLKLTLQNVCTQSLRSLSVSAIHEYDSENMFSFIGVTKRNVSVIHPGKSVCLDFEILVSAPGVYNFSPRNFKLEGKLDDKHVLYQDNVSTIILYD